MLQPAGYNHATQCALLLTVSCFCRILGSVIEERAGTCELLSAVCVIDATGTASAVLLLCFAAATDSGSSKAAATQQCHCRRQPRGHQYVPTWCYRLLMTSATHTAAVFTAVFAVELINLITSINR